MELYEKFATTHQLQDIQINSEMEWYFHLEAIPDI